jgi:hypothetical protein
LAKAPVVAAVVAIPSSTKPMTIFLTNVTMILLLVRQHHLLTRQKYRLLCRAAIEHTFEWVSVFGLCRSYLGLRHQATRTGHGATIDSRTTASADRVRKWMGLRHNRVGLSQCLDLLPEICGRWDWNTARIGRLIWSSLVLRDRTSCDRKPDNAGQYD